MYGKLPRSAAYIKPFQEAKQSLSIRVSAACSELCAKVCMGNVLVGGWGDMDRRHEDVAAR